jgi:PAS domain S-box-containing protein
MGNNFMNVRPLRALIIDDSEDDVLLVVRELKRNGYDLVHEMLDTAGAMKKALEEKQWDVVLCDYKMPAFSAPSAISLLKESNTDIPLIVISGTIGEETAVECMHMGAKDYIMKGNLSRLCPAIARELEEARGRISEKHIKKALGKSEERFRTQYQVSPIPTFTWQKIGGDFVLLECNNAAYKVNGENFKKYIGKTAREIYSGNEGIPQDLHRCFEEKTVIKKELKSKHFLPGRYLVCTYAFVPDDLVMVHVEDITERKLAEEKMRESEARYRALFDRSMDIVFMIDFNGNFIDANKAAINIYGYPKEDLPSLNIASFVCKDQLVLASTIIQEIEETGTQKELSEIKLCHKDRDDVYLESQGSVVISNGKPAAIQVVARDITERKKAEAKLKDTLDSLKKAFGSTVQALASALEFRDPYTAGHQSRATNLACAIAEEIGLAKDRIEGILMAGSVHDIGKLSIPAEILVKPKKLSELEFSLIKEHPQSGYEILKNVESPWPLAQIVQQHHERMNGSGYPMNLKGDEIIMEARILAVADVVEAMASHRPYRAALGVEKALEEIEKNKGVLYDSVVADACVRLFHEKGYLLP